MAKKTGSKGEDLTELPGVGAATAKKLQAAGLNTAAKIAKAGKAGLEKAGLNKASAAKLAAAVAAVEMTKGDQKVKAVKSDDGRKGKTLKVPRSVADMPWFRKN